MVSWRWAGRYLVVALTGIALTAKPALAEEPAAFRSVQHRTLVIDDVLGMHHLDQAILSPDGQWVVVGVQRPADRGQIYGRTAYESIRPETIFG